MYICHSNLQEMNLVEELRWRGMLQDIMPGTEELLNKEMVSGYIGFDPTSDSLHIGSLVPILLLVHLQKAGHKPYALVGGATGMIGDPSFKSEERNLLSEETLQNNLAGIKKQLSKFLDFTGDAPNKAEMVNNYDWFKDFSFLHFIRDVGKHITVNYMMSKDSVRKRLDGNTGMSFTEFTYQLIQGYDFYWLYQNKNCKLQMGGSDQWGNIVTGTEIIRRKAGGEAFAFTCPLLTKADGGKFGKTENGNIWLDDKKTPTLEFYQFWLNASDEDTRKWIKIFTFLSESEIETLTKEHFLLPEKRVLQKRLAQEITEFVHGKDEFNKVLYLTEVIFKRNSMDLVLSLDEEIFNPSRISNFISGSILPTDAITFLTDSGSFPSKKEAKYSILSGALSINDEKISDPYKIIDESVYKIKSKFAIVKKGKKKIEIIKKSSN